MESSVTSLPPSNAATYNTDVEDEDILHAANVLFNTSKLLGDFQNFATSYSTSYSTSDTTASLPSSPEFDLRHNNATQTDYTSAALAPQPSILSTPLSMFLSVSREVSNTSKRKRKPPKRYDPDEEDVEKVKRIDRVPKRPRNQAKHQTSAEGVHLIDDLTSSSIGHVPEHDTPQPMYHSSPTPNTPKVPRKAPSRTKRSSPDSEYLRVPKIERGSESRSSEFSYPAPEVKPPPTKKQGKRCDYCKATTTPMWRHGPPPYHDLCNKCGVKWMRGRILKN